MNKMLTVCIDANVYISAIAFGGKPAKIVELALARRFYLVVSTTILHEVKHNLIKKLDFTTEDVDSFLKIILEVSSIYQPTGLLKFIDYQKDNLVLETALMANADILVTGDKKDLLPLKVLHGVIIESPAAFLNRFDLN
jgi:putative PIN family toxin of toxin-antitoxin system